MAASISFVPFCFSVAGSFLLGSSAAAGFAGFLHRRQSRRSDRSNDDQKNLALLVDRCPDVVMAFDKDLRCTYASPAALRVFGRPAVDLLGGEIGDELSAEDRTCVMAAVEKARSGREGAEATFRSSRPTGELLWIEVRYSAMIEGGGVIGILRDVSTRKTAELALRVANTELNKLAGSDALTELANRRRFDQVLETECRRASRTEGPVSLLLIDVDRFKMFNDHRGHQAGDECLKRIAAAARALTARPHDLAARFGGEEFAILLPATELDGAMQIAERVRDAIEDLAIPHGGNTDAGAVVTVSIGCATVRPTRNTLKSSGTALIAEADRALYDAKRLGRNCVMTPAVDAVSPLVTDQQRLELLADYRAAGLLVPSDSLNRIARMAGVLLGMPAAFVALLERDEVVVVGHYGLGDEANTISHRLCSQAIGARSPLIVTDATLDPRFRDTGLINGFSFLAAAPLLAGEDLQHLGALWVIDRQVRPGLDENKRLLLSRLAALAVEDLQSRRTQADLAQIRVA